MRRSQSGQALVEWAVLLPLYGILASAILAYGQWYVIRHQLISAARQAAFLYSSGRITASETQELVRQNLSKGFPSLQMRTQNIFVGRQQGVQARLFRLDEVRLAYPATSWMQLFNIKEVTEKCVIKHAPSYWQTEIPGANLGPPVPW